MRNSTNIRMPKVRIKQLYLILFLTTPLSIDSREQFIVASEHYPGYVNLDNSGLYLKIVKRIYSNADIKLEISNYARVVNLVKTNKAHFWLGAYKNEQSFALYPEYHFDYDRLAVAYLSDKNNWRGQASLAHKKVAWVKGYDFEKLLKVPYEKYHSVNLKTALKLLKNKRVDYVIDDMVELKNNEEYDEQLNYKVFAKLGLYPAFQNTPVGNSLKELWDKRMAELIASGELADIFASDPDSEYPYESHSH